LPSNLVSNILSTITSSVTTTAATETATMVAGEVDDDVPAHHSSPAVAFMIGLSIIVLSSILNAGGLNLTKLDHVSMHFRVLTQLI
jgi:hypothetical protein